jgi:hypothetical protein
VNRRRRAWLATRGTVGFLAYLVEAAALLVGAGIVFMAGWALTAVGLTLLGAPQWFAAYGSFALALLALVWLGEYFSA